MKAYIYNKYGGPEVLKLKDIEKPEPKGNEISVRVKALSINPSEWHKLTASFWMVRPSSGLFRPKHPILGADIAGIVTETGKNVKHISKGDRVFGRCLSGGLAEICTLEKSSVATIPENIAFENAASLPLAAVTALIALRDKGKIQANQTVLINGASGGIGTFAVQLAKHFKANVTGVCSSKNVDLVKSLGSDEVLDYKKQDIESVNSQFDLILDFVGNQKVNTFTKLLKPEGKCVLVGMEKPSRLFSNMFKGMIITAFGRQKVLPMDAEVASDDLALISQLVAKGKIRPVIAREYGFNSVPEAFTHLGTRRSNGKLLIKITH